MHVLVMLVRPVNLCWMDQNTDVLLLWRIYEICGRRTGITFTDASSSSEGEKDFGSFVSDRQNKAGVKG